MLRTTPEGAPLRCSAPLEVVDGEPRLVAAHCGECHEYSFPLRESCHGCGTALEKIDLPARGVLWTWTTQEFEPASPPYVPVPGVAFEPFAVGYVEFPTFLRVEGRLTERDPDILRIGMEMEVVAVPRGESLTYAFAPVEGQKGAQR